MHGACAARPRIISIAACSVVWKARGNGMSSLLSILYDNPRNASREQLSTSALFGQKTFQHAASAARQADYSACGMDGGVEPHPRPPAPHACLEVPIYACALTKHVP